MDIPRQIGRDDVVIGTLVMADCITLSEIKCPSSLIRIIYTF